MVNKHVIQVQIDTEPIVIIACKCYIIEVWRWISTVKILSSIPIVYGYWIAAIEWSPILSIWWNKNVQMAVVIARSAVCVYEDMTIWRSNHSCRYSSSVAIVTSIYQVNSNLRILNKEGLVFDERIGRMRVIRLNKENFRTRLLLEALKMMQNYERKAK